MKITYSEKKIQLFKNFLWPRIKKDDITAIKKIIATALNKPNLPYVIFAKSNLILFLKIDVFSSLIKSGISSPIFGARDEKLSLLLRFDTFPRLQFLLVNSNKAFTISGDILF